jgi:thymidine kinase
MAKLYFYYSTMNAGKSTALLQASHNYGERGMRTPDLHRRRRRPRRRPRRLAHRHRGEARHFRPGTPLYEEIAAEHAARRSPAC